MATLNMDGFSEEFRETAPMECSCYLFECLSEEEKIKIKEDWNKSGGYKIVPWWKWCMDHINVCLCK